MGTLVSELVALSLVYNSLAIDHVDHAHNVVAALVVGLSLIRNTLAICLVGLVDKLVEVLVVELSLLADNNLAIDRKVLADRLVVVLSLMPELLIVLLSFDM